MAESCNYNNNNLLIKIIFTSYSYNNINNDNNTKHRNIFGGGIGFYIRNTINYRERLDLNSNEIEIFTVEICKYKIKPFLVTTWNRPPNSSIDKLKEFEKVLQLIDTEDKESIIMGDMNCDLTIKEISEPNTK